MMIRWICHTLNSAPMFGVSKEGELPRFFSYSHSLRQTKQIYKQKTSVGIFSRRQILRIHHKEHFSKLTNIMIPIRPKVLYNKHVIVSEDLLSINTRVSSKNHHPWMNGGSTQMSQYFLFIHKSSSKTSVTLLAQLYLFIFKISINFLYIWLCSWKLCDIIL